MADAVSLWRKTPERFDCVLLDTPCSSESRFRRNSPNSHSHWSLRKIKETARKQKKRIYSAVNCLKPGGTLVYCTCAFALEENEAIVDHLLTTFPQQIRISPLELPVTNKQTGITQWHSRHSHETLRGSARVLPNKFMDGFYLCKLLKTASTLQDRNQSPQ